MVRRVCELLWWNWMNPWTISMKERSWKSLEKASNSCMCCLGSLTVAHCLLQAHAWIALGNMCLVDEALAKKNILAFVQNLHTAEAPAVQSHSPPPPPTPSGTPTFPPSFSRTSCLNQAMEGSWLIPL